MEAHPLWWGEHSTACSGAVDVSTSEQTRSPHQLNLNAGGGEHPRRAGAFGRRLNARATLFCLDWLPIDGDHEVFGATPKRTRQRRAFPCAPTKPCYNFGDLVQLTCASGWYGGLISGWGLLAWRRN